ncbi:MAG: hypothetical protein Q9162_006003, partial [Coniocarpon cinnabarinum]
MSHVNYPSDRRRRRLSSSVEELSTPQITGYRKPPESARSTAGAKPLSRNAKPGGMHVEKQKSSVAVRPVEESALSTTVEHEDEKLNRWSSSTGSGMSAHHRQKSSFSRRFSFNAPTLPSGGFRAMSPTKRRRSSDAQRETPASEVSSPTSLPSLHRFSPLEMPNLSFNLTKDDHNFDKPLPPRPPAAVEETPLDLDDGMYHRKSQMHSPSKLLKQPIAKAGTYLSDIQEGSGATTPMPQSPGFSNNEKESRGRNIRDSGREKAFNPRNESTEHDDELSTGPSSEKSSVPSQHGKDGAGSGSKKRSMLTTALRRANDAVKLDHGQDYHEAIVFYEEACDLLDHVMSYTTAEYDRKKLTDIRRTYLNRVDELMDLTGARIELDDEVSVPASVQQASGSEYAIEDDDGSDTALNADSFTHQTRTGDGLDQPHHDRRPSSGVLKSASSGLRSAETRGKVDASGGQHVIGSVAREVTGGPSAGSIFLSVRQSALPKPLSPTRSHIPSETPNVLPPSKSPGMGQSLSRPKIGPEAEEEPLLFSPTNASEYHDTAEPEQLPSDDERSMYSGNYNAPNDQADLHLSAVLDEAIDFAYNSDLALNRPFYEAEDHNSTNSLQTSDEEDVDDPVDNVLNYSNHETPDLVETEEELPQRVPSGNVRELDPATALDEDTHTSEEFLIGPPPPMKAPSPPPAESPTLRNRRLPREQAEKLTINTRPGPSAPGQTPSDASATAAVPLSAGLSGSEIVRKPVATSHSTAAMDHASRPTRSTSGFGGLPASARPPDERISNTLTPNTATFSPPGSLGHESRLTSPQLRFDISERSRMTDNPSARSFSRQLVPPSRRPEAIGHATAIPAASSSFPMSQAPMMGNEAAENRIMSAREKFQASASASTRASRRKAQILAESRANADLPLHLKNMNRDNFAKEGVSGDGSSKNPMVPKKFEPRPVSEAMKPWWLMRLYLETLSHPLGGQLTETLMVQSGAWAVRTSKLKAVSEKISCLDMLAAPLLNLKGINMNDSARLLNGMQSLELAIDQVQGVLQKKIAGEVSEGAQKDLERSAPMVVSSAAFAEAEAASENAHKPTLAPSGRSTAKGGINRTFKRLRNKNSTSHMGHQHVGEGANLEFTMKSVPVAKTDALHEDLGNIAGAHWTIKPLTKVCTLGPNESYAGAVLNICNHAQTL